MNADHSEQSVTTAAQVEQPTTAIVTDDATVDHTEQVASNVATAAELGPRSSLAKPNDDSKPVETTSAPGENSNIGDTGFELGYSIAELLGLGGKRNPRLGWNSPKSILILIRNHTKEPLYLHEQDTRLEYGSWASGYSPPRTIPALRAMWMMVGHGSGITSGLEGIVKYWIGDAGSGNSRFLWCSFDNPSWGGDPKYHAKADSMRHFEYLKVLGDGKDVDLELDVKGGG